MAARTATARLRSLEQQNYSLSYRFTIEPHDQLEQRLLEWAGLRLYGVHIEYDAITPGKKIYTISSDGMWLLSHLFANWEEMDMPPQAKRYQCDECHLYSYTPPWQCPDCKKMLCSRCSTRHIHLKQQETMQHCRACGKLEVIARLTRCSTCMHVFCPSCYATHLHGYDEREAFEENATRQRDEEEFIRQFEQYRWQRTYQRPHFDSWGPRYNFQSSSGSIPATVREALKTLGITGTPTREQITKQYKKLAKEQHPDVGGDTKEMIKINNARDVALTWMKEQEK